MMETKSRLFRLQVIFLLACTSLIAACSAINLSPSSVPGGLLSDPANETQSAIASRAAQSATPPPTSTHPPQSLPPSATPQPTSLPATAAANLPCSESDLLANTRSNITGSTMVFDISLSNVGNQTCSLANPPRAGLASRQGNPLEIQVKTGCTDCLPNSSAFEAHPTSTAISPTQTAATQSFQTNQVLLRPNQSAGIVLIWKNWCDPFPPGGVTINLELAGGQVLVMPADAQRGGNCLQPGEPSTLDISPYYQIK